MGFVVRKPNGSYFKNGWGETSNLQEAKVYATRNTGGKTSSGSNNKLVEVIIIEK